MFSFILLLSGITVAITSGVCGWYPAASILGSGVIFAVFYFSARVQAVATIGREKGGAGVAILFFLQVIAWSIPSAVLYFIGVGFGMLLR